MIPFQRSALSNVANQRAAPPSPGAARKRLARKNKSTASFSPRAAAGGAAAAAAAPASASSTAGLFIFGDSPLQKQRVVVRRAKRAKRAKTARGESSGGWLHVPSAVARRAQAGGRTPDVCPRAPNNTPAGAFTNAVRRRGEIKPTDLFVELFSHTSMLQSSSEPAAARYHADDEKNLISVDKELQNANNASSHAFPAATSKLLGKRMRQQEKERTAGACAPSDSMFSSCSTTRRGAEPCGNFSCSLQ